MNEKNDGTFGVLRGVVFDMDGTLTLPTDLDLAGVRARHNIAAHADIMETIRSRLSDPSPEVRASGEACLADVERVEAAGIERMIIQPGAGELLSSLRSKGLRTALVTRNTRTAFSAFIKRVMTTLDDTKSMEDGSLFDYVITRDDLPDLPHKPAPDPLLHIARVWGFKPNELVMVGDFLHDMQCGNAAGSRTILLLNDTNHDYAPLSTLAVSSLLEMLPSIANWMQKQ